MPSDDFYVYVLPARYDDILKIGFTRDPWFRVRAFHPRYYDWFSLEEGFLLTLPGQREARYVERSLADHAGIHRSRSPGEIRRAAGGHTEWYRGALDTVRRFAEQNARELGVLGTPSLEGWLRDRLNDERAELYEWSAQMFDSLTLVLGNDQLRIARALRDYLDAFAHFDIDIAMHLMPEVWCWWKCDNET